MRVIVSGGGTGGHIYPALAIVEEIRKRDKEADILYIGTKNSMEERLAKENNINFKSIRVKGLPRKLNKKSFIAVKELFIGLSQAGKIVKEFKPDLVIGTGGFVSGPILFRAAIKGITTVIHEQNNLPGITNRILSRFVTLILATYESSKKYFKHPDRVRITGNPIRASVDKVTKSKTSFEKYGLSENLPVVFSFGGSNGSEDMNKAVGKMIGKYKDKMNFQILHATGRGNYDDFMNKASGVVGNNKVKILAYIDDIKSAYDISDIVIASSGAITLAEISLMGLASILIPKAYTTENHQEYNARLYQDIGASEMILESELNEDLLYNKIDSILKDKDILKTMGENAKKLGNPNSTRDIVDICLSTIKK